MILLRNVSKKFGNEKILEQVNIAISSPGLYGFIGPSGSGKSTLLHLIGLADPDYEGSYYLNQKNVASMSEKEKNILRQQYFSFIFQSPKLIENETVYQNLCLGTGRKLREEEVRAALQKVNLRTEGKARVNTLSGGEKQRVNLALVLLKDTPVILGDEITSGLDEKNKPEVLSLLKKLAETKIVLLVTHDTELLKEYTDHIYALEKKHLPEIKETGRETLSERKKKKETALPFSYLIKHVFRIIKEKKGRSLVCIFSSTVALVCLGLCVLLTGSLSDGILSSLGNLIKEDQIVMEKKEESYLIEEDIVLDSEELKSKRKYLNGTVTRQGSYYLTDMSDFFPDREEFSLKLPDYQMNLKQYSVTDINDYTFFEEEDENDLFVSSYDLKSNEVVLALTRYQVTLLCSALNIPYEKDDSLMTYLEENKIPLVCRFANKNWSYDLTFTLYVTGYEVSSVPGFYHTAENWNEEILENTMHLSSSLNLNENDDYPWTLKKKNYFAVREESLYEACQKILKSSELNDYLFDVFYLHGDPCISLEYAHDDSLRISSLEEMLTKEEELKDYLPCSELGYNVVSEALMCGFSYPSFLCDDYQVMEQYIDYNSYSDQNLGNYQSTILTVPDENMYSLSLLDSSKENAVHLSGGSFFLKAGRIPENECELVLSEDLASTFDIAVNPNDFREKNIYFMGLKSIDYANGKYRNNYAIVKMKVVGISDLEGRYVSVDSLWPVIFSMMHLEKAEKDLFPDKAVFSFEGEDITSVIERLNRTYPSVSFSNPYLDYKEEIDQTISYVELGLSAFSFFCLFSSLLMEIMASYLFVIDNRKEIGIYSYLGYSRASIKKEFRLFSLLLSLYSGLLSCLSLGVIVIFMKEGFFGYTIALGTETLQPFFLVLLVSFLIGESAGTLSIFRILHQKTLTQLQEN